MVASSHTLTVTTPSDREIVMTRTFDAPRELVFEAMTKPEHMKEWWGPRGYTMPVCEIDLRPGGEYRFVSADADGNEYAFRGEYREIVRSGEDRLDLRVRGDAGQRQCRHHDPRRRRTAKTTITSTSVFDSVEQRDGMLESGMETGAAETYDRLAELLEKLQTELARNSQRRLHWQALERLPVVARGSEDVDHDRAFRAGIAPRAATFAGICHVPPGPSSRVSSPIRNVTEPETTKPSCSFSWLCSRTTLPAIELDDSPSTAVALDRAGEDSVPDPYRPGCRDVAERAHLRLDDSDS